MERLVRKWETTKQYVPAPEIILSKASGVTAGIIYYGTSEHASKEALDGLHKQAVDLDALRIRAFPFNQDVDSFIAKHDVIYVVDQNRDAQMRTLLINELEINPVKLVALTHYDGMPITASFIEGSVLTHRASLSNANSQDAAG